KIRPVVTRAGEPPRVAVSIASHLVDGARCNVARTGMNAHGWNDSCMAGEPNISLRTGGPHEHFRFPSRRVTFPPTLRRDARPDRGRRLGAAAGWLRQGTGSRIFGARDVGQTRSIGAGYFSPCR